MRKLIGKFPGEGVKKGPTYGWEKIGNQYGKKE